ncbi:hypothetical protein [Luteimicrobium sp. DT211]|uniref:hypothetical protein n=1 Tax=Luteimicrobium sp. DT211 TaxID=3393412 RepID=UPI003CE9258B
MLAVPAAAILAAAAFIAPSAHADDAVTPSDEPTLATSDFLDADIAAPGDGGQAGQSDQCDLDIAERVGAWTCPETTPAEAVSIEKEALSSLLAEGKISKAEASEETVKPLSTGTTCDISGCWTLIDTAHTTYSGAVAYGYGKTGLGSGQMYFKVTASGAKTTSYPFWFKATRGTSQSVLEGERFYVSSAHPGGNKESPRHAFGPKVFGTRSADISSKWPSPGATTYEKTTQWITIVHEASWRDISSAYPGRWYMWAKSYKGHRQSSGAYYFQKSLPSEPRATGYSSD